jgi:prolyl-tRNA synthetase
LIVPIYKGDEQKAMIDEKVNALMAQLRQGEIRVKYDDNDNTRPGWKFAEYEMKGVPVRITFGARDLENNLVEVARRDTKEKNSVSLDGLAETIITLLEDVQNNMFNKAKAYQQSHITEVNSWEEFEKVLEEKGGFISAHWDGTPESEEEIKQKTKATIRCIPIDNKQEDGVCVLSGKPSKERVLFARAY